MRSPEYSLGQAESKSERADGAEHPRSVISHLLRSDRCLHANLRRRLQRPYERGELGHLRGTGHVEWHGQDNITRRFYATTSKYDFRV